MSASAAEISVLRICRRKSTSLTRNSLTLLELRVLARIRFSLALSGAQAVSLYSEHASQILGT